MLLGWALRTFGPALRYRQNSESPTGADVLMARLSWRRFSSALGAVVSTAGIALTLMTFILILVNPGNVVGSRIAWGCFVLVLIAVAAWLWIYVGRFGIYGLMPERPEPATVFRSARPTPEDARPSTEARPVAPPVFDDIEEYVDDDEPWYDDEYGDVNDEELESRYAKYELHHPDEMDETAAYLPVPDQDEPELPEDDEPSMIETLDYELDEQSSETSDETVVPLPDDHEATIISDKPINEDEDEAVSDMDEPVDSPAPIPAEHADVGRASENLVDDIDDVDSGNVVNHEDAMTLADTPEGRAEALRRIEAWHPDDASNEDQDSASEPDNDGERDEES